VKRPSAPPNQPTSLVFDSFDTIPEYESLRRAVNEGSWTQLDVLLTEMTSARAAFALTELAEKSGIESFLEAASVEYPTSAFASTALAYRYIAMGWAVRGIEESEEVPGQRLEEFRSLHLKAEQLLLTVCANHPHFAPAWAARLSSARGLHIGKAEIHRRYRHLLSESPTDYPAQAEMLQALLPNWYGTLDEAYAFALEAAHNAESGSSAAGLIAIYHLERWVSLGGSAPGKNYLVQAEVQRDLMEASERVLDTSNPLDPIAVQVHNVFFLTFWIADRHLEAVQHLRLLGNRITRFPVKYTTRTMADWTKIRHDLYHAEGASI
jgi:hypothetical protein